MSTYRTLADSATPRPWTNDASYGHEGNIPSYYDPANESLARALVNNADAIERLWLAADQLIYEGALHVASTDDEARLMETVKALRPLFGEDTHE